MEKALSLHQPLHAGTSLAACAAIPLAAFAVTLPFEGAHSVVNSAAIPFVLGSVAGVGALVAASAISERIEGTEAKTTPKADAQQTVEPKHTSTRGVPVIARAVDALSEAQAWEEIDACMSGDSPISCDPTHSRDIYQLAYAEMARAAHDLDATASFMSAYNPTTPHCEQPTAVFTAAASIAKIGIDDLDEPDLYPTVEQENLVPMADYSGHEDMWAAAMAIMDESPTPMPSPVVRDPFAAEPSSTADVAPGRMEAIAEGAHETGMHSLVNEILEEEFEKVNSSSVRSTSRRYLEVIQGGTMSMPRLTAEG